MNMRIAAVMANCLALKQGISPSQYMEQVLLRNLQQTPGIDLSQSSSSKPKGVSNGK